MLFTGKKKLIEITPLKFSLEKNLQKLVEENIETIFGLKFVSSEFQLHGLRVDTLAFDEETQPFVIIEYKRDRSFSVIDQGYAYLSLMLNHKADFILELNEKTHTHKKKDSISRSESRVIFVANSFTLHQKQAIDFKDLPIELREAQKYQGDIYSFDQIRANNKSESIHTITQISTSINKISGEIKTYDINDHIKNDWTQTQKLYEELCEGLLRLDTRIKEDPKKMYIGYKIGNKVVVGIIPQKSKIKMEFYRIQPEHVKDPEGKLSSKKNAMKYYNKYVSTMYIQNEDDISYALLLTKQVLAKFFS